MNTTELTSLIPSSTVIIWVVGVALAYTVGRIGIPQFYQDIKHVVQGIKGDISGAKAAVTTTPTPVKTA